MNCPKCGKPMKLVESDSTTRPPTKKVCCAECGYVEVKNDQGQKLLTEVQPTHGVGLTEG